MNPSDEQLMWRYLDGDCSPEEQQRVEDRLREDLRFKAAWAERRALHLRLQREEAAHPSLRFVQNVMDRLTPTLQIEPLVSRRQLRVWLAGTGAFLLLIVGTTWELSSAAAGHTPVDPYLQTLNEFLTGLPPQALVLIGALSIGFLILRWLDRRLQERFG